MFNFLLGFANIYFSCLMLRCQSFIGGQNVDFCHCLIEVISFHMTYSKSLSFINK
jgi:hypothetical protein